MIIFPSSKYYDYVCVCVCVCVKENTVPDDGLAVGELLLDHFR